MAAGSRLAQLERALEAQGLHVVVEQNGNVVTLSGEVNSAGESQAAEDVVRAVAPDLRIDNGLTVRMVIPEQVGDRTSDEPSPTELPESVAEIEDLGVGIEPDFTDQTILEDASAAVGAPGDSWRDPVQEGNDVYVPPTDPVTTLDQDGQPEVLGGFETTSMDEIAVPRSASDNRLGDEAIADTIRQELREDAATTDLEIAVYVRQGIVHLRGTVQTLDDAENAEAVARRVPGVRDVAEELTVLALS